MEEMAHLHFNTLAQFFSSSFFSLDSQPASCLLSVSQCSEHLDDATTSSFLTSFTDVCLSASSSLIL